MNTDFLVANVRVTLRPVDAGDAEFLSRVYAGTRTDEMALVNWSDEQKAGFLKMQFDAQTQHYKIHYPTAETYILQREGTPIGRLITERSPKQLLIMDIALLPEYRNTGIGSTLIRDLMNEAAQTGVPLVLHVEFFNPAIRLYTRLGFVKTTQVNEVYHQMVWTPESRPVVE